ncbi:MAG TPA: GNAT family N-acetyltransferase [Kouleothrix sp.]|nr:GNAT family N-acetyltransferase [Kouleothrix sp.]
MLTIEQLSPEAAHAALPALADLLADSVASGASIGFLPPFGAAEARDYWEAVIADMRQASRLLLLARRDAAPVGTAQLELATKPNALHRAEVQKVLVHSQARRQGIGRALMAALATLARQHGRSLLVLDTRQGDPSEQLYRSAGYTLAGTIPGYARNADGTLAATALYYHVLE